MNEVITRLDEIEEKANALITDAREQKDQLQLRLAQEKSRIDEEYEVLEKKHFEELKTRLNQEADQKILELKKESQEAVESLEETYQKNKDELVEELFVQVCDS